MLENILPVTKVLLLSSVVCTFAPLLGVISYNPLMYFNIPKLLFKEPFRLIPSFFVMPFVDNTFTLLMRFYSLYLHSQNLEISYFTKKSQYCYFLFFNMTMVILLTFYFKNQVFWYLEPCMHLMLSFTYSMVFWDNDIKYYGILPMKCKYSCLVDLFFSFVFAPKGAFIMHSGLLGLVSAYIYTCLATRSFGPVFGFFKHRLLKIEDPQYRWETGVDLQGKTYKFKVENSISVFIIQKRIKEYGFTGGIPLYPNWVDKLLNKKRKSEHKIKTTVAHNTVDTGRKLGRTEEKVKTEEKIKTETTDSNEKEKMEKNNSERNKVNKKDEKSEASIQIANFWANKYKRKDE
ncbi:hypothetical protein HANVADRAFT_49244 [Hanseniaspora valbyensis NRRL Y-1626]|uniref:Derlin n=1 Tax=Hanseniaspora valbyensis NRRL Y-1626 TaxID=766949 RepID=A0A1B7TC91_9ASCO|nr:hypothetical protein HANVADRAFT_49244 [Hanseniaspora valbyensis NRRL Y-1626]